MKRILFAIFLLILISTFSFSQDKQNEKSLLTEISVCPIELLETGKTLDWRFNFAYKFNTDKNGYIEELTHTQKSKLMSSFIDQNKILNCILRWKLKPQDNYQAEIITGNILVNTSFSLSSKKEKITYSYDTKTFEFETLDKKIDSKKEITVCSINLRVGVANFYSSYRFIVTTDKIGNVDKVQQLSEKSALPFFNFEDFAPCIKNWKLEPNENYGVLFSLGTKNSGVQRNFIEISSKNESIKMYLGSLTEDLIDRPIPEKVENKEKDDTTKNF